MSRQRREPFAAVDATWLRMEDPTNLMMITGVLMFDQSLDYLRLCALLEQRLVGRFDRFRKRAIVPPNGVGSPYWEDDAHFTLDSHIHRIALPAPGDQHALEDLVSDLMSVPLDFSKPLWQFHVVEGYGTGSALIVRLHHSIADGIALVYVLLSLTDNSADPVHSVPEPAPASAGNPAAMGNPFAALLKQASHAVATLRNAGEALLREGQQIVEQPERLGTLARQGADSLAALGKLVLMPPDPMTILKGPLGVQKRAIWSQPIALDTLKAIGKVTGSTINDVLLAAVGGALRSYLIERGSSVDGLNIRAVVPVNLRPLDRPPTMGNVFGVVFLALPLGLAHPYDRLVELRERMEAIKGSPEAIVAFGILNVMGISPESLQDIGVGLFGSKATAVMTNVPGPRETIYLAGSPVRGSMFWVPQSGRLGIGVSIFSYAGEVLVGVAVDADLIPNPERIIEGFHQEIDTLSGLIA